MADANYDYILDEIERCKKLFECNFSVNSDEE